MLLTRNQNNEGLLRTIDNIYRNEVRVQPKSYQIMRKTIIKIIILIVCVIIGCLAYNFLPESNIKNIILITTTVIGIILFFWLMGSNSIFFMMLSFVSPDVNGHYKELKKQMKKHKIEIEDEDYFYDFFIRYFRINVFSREQGIEMMLLSKQAKEYYNKRTGVELTLLELWNSIKVFPEHSDFFLSFNGTGKTEIVFVGSDE